MHGSNHKEVQDDIARLGKIRDLGTELWLLSQESFNIKILGYLLNYYYIIYIIY